jgi:DNA modification methylase
VRILEHLLKLGSMEDALVFDPFMGVESSGVAALNMKRRFLGLTVNRFTSKRPDNGFGTCAK